MELIRRYFPGLNALQQERFAALGPLYHGWNARINVVSRKDMDHFYQRHVLHALSIAACCPLAPGQSVIDIGTGGGFPGIPLAIFFPETTFHLVDSIGKKIRVVEAVKEALSLHNVTTAQTRAEDIKDRRFDAAVTRAVAPLEKLLQWSRPLLRTGGDAPGLLCLKGGDLSEEISRSRCNPRIYDLHRVFPEPYFKEKYLLQIPR